MDSLTGKFKQPIVPASKSLQSVVIKDYQNNLRIFVKKVQSQISLLIQKYQKEIRQLRKQNNLLRQKLSRHEEINPEQKTSLNNIFGRISPIKQLKSSPQVSLLKLNSLNATQKQETYFHQSPHQFKSYLQFEGEDLSNSRFETQKNKNKIKQQNLLSSLEAGKNNLNMNTSKLFDLLGKNKQPKEESQPSQQQQKQTKSDNENKDSMNTSLSLICQSLDNSFHSNKSRKKNTLKRKQKERIRKMKLEQAKKHYKQRKQQGLKNLLRCLRQNVCSNQVKPLQTIKSVKVANSQYEIDKDSPQSKQKPGDKKNGESPSKSKVLIDPNPIDISKRRSKLVLNESQKKIPQSILKNSSTILSKSLISNSP